MITKRHLLFSWLIILLLAMTVLFLVCHRPIITTDATFVDHLVLPDGSIYRGELHRGLLHGKGKLRQPWGDVYEGEFADGVFSGEGLLITAEGDEYRGLFAQGEQHGEGEHIIPDGSVYRGNFQSGLYHGQGQYESAKGDKYVGTFAQGEIAEGSFTGTWGEQYEGQFQQWDFHGKGVLKSRDGTYTGEFKEGFPDGEGEYHPSEGGAVLRGNFQWGKFVDPDSPRDLIASAHAFEEAIYRQQNLLQQLDEELQENNPAEMDTYFLGVAGYSAQDVFLKEVSFIRDLMDEQFDTKGRSLLLVNHQDTLDKYPLATTTSIAQSLQKIAQKMDPEKDLLFIYLTSHGSANHEFQLEQDGLRIPDLSAQRLGEMINALPAKWKIIMVSACYSGGFIPALENPQTLVITAARQDRRSFGCSDYAEMTYFGRAFFQHAIGDANSFEDAFAITESLILEWEKALGENIEHSHPQMAMGAEIKHYLPQWWERVKAQRKHPAGN